MFCIIKITKNILNEIFTAREIPMKIKLMQITWYENIQTKNVYHLINPFLDKTMRYNLPDDITTIKFNMHLVIIIFNLIRKINYNL